MISIWHEITIELLTPTFIDQETLRYILLERNITALAELSDSSISFYTDLPNTFITTLIAELTSKLAITSKVIQLKTEDWQNKWFENWFPLEVGNLEIIPIKDQIPSAINSDKQPIFIKPGLGFGTGHHATTHMLLSFLQEDYLRASNPQTICDFGTGSGILAIAANKIFSKPTLAIDNDPLALQNASENCQLNGSASQIHLKAGSIELLSDKFDLLIANLYAELLVEFHSDLVAALNSKGHLLVSGILVELWPSVQSSFVEAGLKLVEHKTSVAEANSPTWCAAVFKKE